MLGDVLGITIELEERESSVEAFSLDILARDQDSGEAVVIENQIEQSDHEHLGKLITYASGKDAKYIVWIVKDAREEHRAAIEWLNKGNTAQFPPYGLSTASAAPARHLRCQNAR